MFQDSDYAPSQGSFTTPVPIPVSEPDASPTVSVEVNCDWIPYILGALQQLVLQATWKTDDSAALTQTQQRAMTLMSMFVSAATASAGGCPGVLTPFACTYDFTLSGGGWNPFPGFGHYTLLQGFVSDTLENDAGACLLGLAIHLDLSSAPVTLTHLRVRGNREEDAGTAGSAVYVTVGGVQSLFGTLPSLAGSFDVVVSHAPVGEVTDIEIDLGTHFVPGPCSPFGLGNLIDLVELFGSASTSPCA